MTITYEQLKERIPALAVYDSDGNEIDRYKTFLEKAENWLINNITDKALFTAINASTDTEAKNHCINIICYKGYIDAMPFLDLIDSGSGFSVTNNQNLAPASKERVSALKAAMIEMLTTSIEDFIIFLEKTAAYHDEWKSSNTYSILTETFIHTLTEFIRYAPFTGSRLDFIKALPAMKNAMQLKIAPIISKEFVEEIIEQLRDDDLTEANKKIIENLKFAYSNYVINEINVADMYIVKVQNYMIDNIDNYQVFKASKIYTQYLANQTTKPNEIILDTMF